MLNNSACVSPGSNSGPVLGVIGAEHCCGEKVNGCTSGPHNGNVWWGHSCFWDSFPSGMSSVLRGLAIQLGGLIFTDLEAFTIISTGQSAVRTWLNYNLLGSPTSSLLWASVAHSQTTDAKAYIKTGARTDIGEASITIDQLRIGLRAFVPNPYMRAALGTVFTPPSNANSGSGVPQGNGRQVYYWIVPSFRITINSLSATTPGSIAWSLNSGQSPRVVNGQYAGPYQHGVPDFDKCSFVVAGVQAIAIAPTYNVTAGGESGILTLRSWSGQYPVWLGVGTFPSLQSDGTWKIIQRLPAFDLQALRGTSGIGPTTIGFPPCVSTSFTPINDDRVIGGPVGGA